jgi:hypothetical protein
MTKICAGAAGQGNTMNLDDIIRMAREAGIGWLERAEGISEFLERFANLVAAAEREACAKVCEEMAAKDKLSNYYKVAALLIRERGAP